MIKTRKDLRFYIQEDAKSNGYYKRYFSYIVGLLMGYENAYVFITATANKNPRTWKKLSYILL